MGKMESNLVAVVENVNGAGLAVTLVNKPKSVLLERCAIPISSTLNSPNYKITSTSQTDRQKTLTSNAGIQICDDRFISSYQVAHCNLRPTSPPLPPTEYPTLSSKQDTKHVRVTKHADLFADSLRKYPEKLTALTGSSELIERVLSVSLSKRMNQERAKKANSALHHRLSKYIDSDPKYTDGVNGGVAINAMKDTLKPRLSPLSTTKSLSKISPRVQRMGRNAEVRYLNDVRKCIRDAIRNVCDDKPTVCPKINRRKCLHHKRHHNPCCSKDACCETRCSSHDGLLSQSLSRELVSRYLGQKPQSGQDSNICCECLEALPCKCLKETPKILNNSIWECKNCCNRNRSLKGFCSSKSCCRFFKEERQYHMKVLKEVFDWMQEIPVNVNFSHNDNMKIEASLRKLVNKLLEFRGMPDNQKDEIKKCLGALPMWQPVNKQDRDIFVDNLSDNLIERLNRLTHINQYLTETISNWINETLLDGISGDDKSVHREKILNDMLFQLKPLELNENVDDSSFKELIKSSVKHVLKDIPFKRKSDINFIDQAANNLFDSISSLLRPNVSTVRNITANNNFDKNNQKRPKLENESDVSSFSNDPQWSKISVDNIKETATNEFSFKKTDPDSENDYIQQFPQIIQDRHEIDRGQDSLNLENRVIDDPVYKRYKIESSILEDLPSNFNYDKKKYFKEEIINTVAKKNNTPYKSLIEREASVHNLLNKIKKERPHDPTSSFTDSAAWQRNNEDYVKKKVGSILDKHIETAKSNILVKNILTDLITDQIVRGGSNSSIKDIACSILERINVPEKQVEELYNTIVQHTMSSIQNNGTLNLFGVDSTKYKERRDILMKVESEILFFIDNILCNKDQELKQKLLKAIRLLATKIEKTISSTHYSTVDKENIISKLVLEFLKFHVIPKEETIERFATNLAKLLLRHSVQTSTPKTITDGKGHEESDNGYFNGHLDHELNEESLSKMQENPNLQLIYDEILKWIQTVPSNYIVSQNKSYHELVAKDIAKKLQELICNHNSNLDMLIDHEILQWLPKIAKLSEDAELNTMINNLIERMKQKIMLDLGLKSESLAGQNKFTDYLKDNIMDWLKNTQMYQKRTSHEKNIQENLVSNLAKEINDILYAKNGTDNVFDNGERIRKAIETQITRFPMDARVKLNNKYHRKMALEMFNHLKNLGLLDNVLKQANIKKSILKWLQSLPLQSNPDYQYLIDKIIALVPNISPSEILSSDIETYIKKEITNLFEDLVFDEDFYMHDELEIFANKLIKSLQQELNNQTDELRLTDSHSHILNELSLNEPTGSSHDKTPDNTYNSNNVNESLIINNSGVLLQNLDNIHEDSILLPARPDPVEKRISNNNIGNIEAEKSFTSEAATLSRKYPRNFSKSQNDQKNMMDTENKLTERNIDNANKENAIINSVNENFANGSLPHESDQVINTVSENYDYLEPLLPSRDDLFTIAKDISSIRRQTSVEDELRKRLHNVIDRTLSTNSNLFSKPRPSLERMKEKLVNAFIHLNEMANGNKSRYKDNLRNEVNKFCHAYLQRYPATPIDTDQLCADLYNALKSVPLSNDQINSSKNNQNYTKDAIERIFTKLPLQDSDKNEVLLKEFINSLVKYIKDQKSNSSYLIENDKVLEKKLTDLLKQVSFHSEPTSNIKQIKQDIIKTLENSFSNKKDKNRRNQYTEKDSEDERLSGQLSPVNEYNQRFPENFNDRAPSVHGHSSSIPQQRDNYTQTGNLPDTTGRYSEYFIPSERCHLVNGKSFIQNAPCSSIQRSDRQSSLKTNAGLTQGNQMQSQYDVSPRIIIKEYYWDSKDSNPADNTKPEISKTQSLLRRTVPSLPLSQSTAPCVTFPSQRVENQTSQEEPQQTHKSTPQLNSSTVAQNINKQAVDDMPLAAISSLSNIKYKHGTSSHNLAPNNKDEFAPFIIEARPRKQRRKFCKEQFTTCSRTKFHTGKTFNTDLQRNIEDSKYGASQCSSRVSRGLNAKTTSVNEKDRLRCDCFNYKPRNITDRLTAISNCLGSNHKLYSSLCQCKQCRGNYCPHPSFFYFN